MGSGDENGIVFASTKSVVTENGKIINHNTRFYLAPAAVEYLRFMPLVYGLCLLRFKHFVRGKKVDALQNVCIPANCQSWRQLSINPCF